MGWFIFIAFLVGFFMICHVGANISDCYNVEADNARDQYAAEYAEDFRKFNISSEEALSKIKSDREHDRTVLGHFFWISLIFLIISVIGIALLDDALSVSKKEKNQIPFTIYCAMIALFWGYISAVVSTSSVTSGIKERIYKRLENYRCPHCNAPLSYFETDVYTDGTVYFQKKVSKYDYDLKMDVYVTENWMRYNEHHIYTCDYCRKKDDKVTEKEEKIDKTSFMRDSGIIRA